MARYFASAFFHISKTVAGFLVAQLFISKFGPVGFCQRVTSIPAKISGLKI
jgi:hypothetical protein